jgi:hypothetical protein
MSRVAVIAPAKSVGLKPDLQGRRKCRFCMEQKSADLQGRACLRRSGFNPTADDNTGTDTNVEGGTTLFVGRVLYPTAMSDVGYKTRPTAEPIDKLIVGLAILHASSDLGLPTARRIANKINKGARLGSSHSAIPVRMLRLGRCASGC